MRRVYIAASRGRDPQNPTDRKHSVRGRSEQRFEINGGVRAMPSRQLARTT